MLPDGRNCTFDMEALAGLTLRLSANRDYLASLGGVPCDEYTASAKTAGRTEMKLFHGRSSRISKFTRICLIDRQWTS